MKIFITIAECLGTDGEFTSEVYTSRTAQESSEHASSLIADMLNTMSVEENIDPTATWEIKGDGWYYRVRVEEHDVFEPTITKQFATNIEWDTDDEDAETLGLPNKVEIPSNMDIDTFADWLSDEYGFCHFGFYVENIEVDK